MKPEVEEPVFKTCLGVPINVALMIWAVLRLLLVAVVLIPFGYNLFLLIAFGYDKMFATLSVYHSLILIFLAMLVDIPCLIVLMVGVCKKSSAILGPIYFYEIFVLAFEALMVPVIFYMIYIRDPHFTEPIQYILLGVVGFIILSVDTAAVLALKSKLAMMRNSELPEFVKMNGEDRD